MEQQLLTIDHIDVHYGEKMILHDVTMGLRKGQIVGIVGESGSGKSTTIYSVLGVLGKGGKVTSGEILYDEKNLLKLKKRARNELCGAHLSLIAQNPTDSFHPIRKIKSEFRELAKAHRDFDYGQAEENILHSMEKMKLDSKSVMEKYAYELSGGMCQRASIAMAMALSPEILFADEPTSALDVTVQKEVVEELMQIRDAHGTSIMIVSHNMGVISYISDYIYVMLAGLVVECGSRDQVMHNPQHPYTRNLIKVIPRANVPAPRGVVPTEYERSATACPYHKVCPLKKDSCLKELPPMKELEAGRCVRCHFV